MLFLKFKKVVLLMFENKNEKKSLYINLTQIKTLHQLKNK